MRNFSKSIVKKARETVQSFYRSCYPYTFYFLVSSVVLLVFIFSYPSNFEGLNKTILGPNNRILVLNERQRFIVSLHEQNIQENIKSMNPVYKVIISIVKRELVKNGLDPSYAYILLVENSISKTSGTSYFLKRSSQQAAGAFQFISLTAKNHGVLIHKKNSNSYYDERFDFFISLEAFISYISWLEGTFKREKACSNDTVRLVMSSYHSGRAALKRTLKHHSTCDVYQINKTVGSYGRDSMNYVPKIDATRLYEDSYKSNSLSDTRVAGVYRIFKEKDYILFRQCKAQSNGYLYEVVDNEFGMDVKVFREINMAFYYTREIVKGNYYSIRLPRSKARLLEKNNCLFSNEVKDMEVDLKVLVSYNRI